MGRLFYEGIPHKIFIIICNPIMALGVYIPAGTGQNNRYNRLLPR